MDWYAVPMALSLDLRQRIADALDTGQAQKDIAQRFAVSVPTVERIARRVRQGRSLEPGRSPGRSPQVTKEQYQAFQDLARSRTDWTLQSLGAAWQEQGGKPLCESTVWRTLKRIEFTFKKSAESQPNVMLSNETSS
jgi:transposase